MKHVLPKLSYDYNALEPYIDAKTMEIHHTKHHQGYVDKLNGVLEKYPDIAERPVEDLLVKIDELKMDETDKTALRNNGGGHVNHSFFWTIMGPVSPGASRGGPRKEADERLISDINEAFGSLDEFKKNFAEAAATRFGSGWAWLVRKTDGKLNIYSTPNQDSPLMMGDTPMIGLDVWEHAYYLKYQNKRPDYIEAWWNVLKII